MNDTDKIISQELHKSALVEEALKSAHVQQSFLNDYVPISLPTDIARTKFKIATGGNSILIFSSPVNIDIRLHNSSNEIITLKQLDSLIHKEGFKEFYITHSALAGGTINMIVYTNQNLFISVAGRTASSGGSASTIGHNSLALTLANTEYSVALTNNVKRIKLINNSVDAVFYVSTLNGDSANGIPIPPLSTHNIENIDLESYSLYVQSDIASRALYYMEFL